MNSTARQHNDQSTAAKKLLRPWSRDPDDGKHPAPRSRKRLKFKPSALARPQSTEQLTVRQQARQEKQIARLRAEKRDGKRFEARQRFETEFRRLAGEEQGEEMIGEWDEYFQLTQQRPYKHFLNVPYDVVEACDGPHDAWFLCYVIDWLIRPPTDGRRMWGVIRPGKDGVQRQWIYQSYRELESKVRMNKHQIEDSVKRLKKLGFLLAEPMRVRHGSGPDAFFERHPTTHFSVNPKPLNAAIKKIREQREQRDLDEYGRRVNEERELDQREQVELATSSCKKLNKRHNSRPNPL